MTATPSLYHRGLLGLAVTLAVLPFLLSTDPLARERLDLCYITRPSEKPPAPLIPLADGLVHDLSVLLLWITLFVLTAVLPQQRTSGFFSLLYITLWFHATYVLLAALKVPLSDYRCAGRNPYFPNAISGHYCYFVFVLLTTPRLFSQRLSVNKNISAKLLLLLSVLLSTFVVGAFATLYRTFFHGYHSLRQISFGIAFGLVSHVLLDVVHFSSSSPPVSTQLPVLFANSLSAFALYLRLWPHHLAGPAIPPSQFLFHISLYLLLLLAASRLPSSRLPSSGLKHNIE